MDEAEAAQALSGAQVISGRGCIVGVALWFIHTYYSLYSRSFVEILSDKIRLIHKPCFR